MLLLVVVVDELLRTAALLLVVVDVLLRTAALLLVVVDELLRTVVLLFTLLSLELVVGAAVALLLLVLFVEVAERVYVDGVVELRYEALLDELYAGLEVDVRLAVLVAVAVLRDEAIALVLDLVGELYVVVA